MFFLLNITVFLAAFLLFQIELIVSKAMLPGFGGSYLVWSVSVMLFQGLLLLGYAYAHASGKYFQRTSLPRLHLLVLLLPMAFFPIELGVLTHQTHSLPFVLEISWTLLRTIGMGFFVLSSLSIILQSYLAGSQLAGRTNPYVLYATSNLGSFSGLLSYPFLVEPLFDLNTQLIVWQVAYVLVAILFACNHAYFARHKHAPVTPLGSTLSGSLPGTRVRIPLLQRLHWLICSAAGTAMFLAVTNLITFDLAAMPLIWILPLCVYLLSFVITFKKKPWYPDWLRQRFPLAAAIGVFLFFMMLQSYKLPILVLVAIHLLVLLVVCVTCHGELNKNRPQHAEALPEFYIMLALGGFLGSVIVSWLVPLTSNTTLEYCVGFLFVALGFALREKQKPTLKYVILALLVAPLLAAWALVVGKVDVVGSTITAAIAGFFLALLFYGLRHRPLELALCLFLAIISAQGIDLYTPNQTLVHKHRNFYGIYRVYDQEGKRHLKHGTTLHGSQYLAPARQHEALTYYHATGPVGQVLLSGLFEQKHVGVIGLGAGSLAVYARPGDTFDFYELDAYNEIVAEKYFTFLKQCKGKLGIITGDGRLSLKHVPNNYYSIFILDAFNSDSIPVHLLTVEAIQEYLRCLKPNGLLLFHISNKFMNLQPIVYANAQATGVRPLIKTISPAISHADAKPCIWAAFTRNDHTAELLINKLGWKDMRSNPPATVHPWTDRYTNLLDAFK